MTIYWERCDLCGGYKPTRKCSLIPDIYIDVHCCVSCIYWMNKCKNPAWKIESTSMRVSTRQTLSSAEKESLLKELTSLLGKS